MRQNPKYYSYYHCYKPCNTRYKVEEVDNWFSSFLSSISLDTNAQKLLTKLIEQRIKTQTKNERLSPKHYTEVASLEQKLVRLQDLYLDGEFDSIEYQNAKIRIQSRLNELKDVQSAFQKSKKVLHIYKKGLKKLESFDKQFTLSNLDQKRQLIGSIFPEKFQFEDNKVRTADINPVLLKIATVNKDLKGNKKRDKSKKIDLSREVLKAGLEPARP